MLVAVVVIVVTESKYKHGHQAFIIQYVRKNINTAINFNESHIFD